MGSKGTKDLTNEDYQECCEAIKDFLSWQEKELKIENAADEVMKKFNPKEKKAIILGFIKTLVEKEKSEKILKNMEEIFIKLFEQYEQIHTQEEGSKKFSENAEEKKKTFKKKKKKKKNEIMKKFDKKEKKPVILDFIKHLIEKEKREKILKNMIEIFINLNDQYEQIHKKEENSFKTFSEPANDIDKNIINAIYISKIFEDDIDEDAKIHDYAVYLYSENVVNEIEEGNNNNIVEDFKNYKEDNLESTKEENNKKFNEFCKEKGIDPEKYGNSESSSSQKEVKTDTNKKPENNKQENLNNNQENKDFDINLNKNKYNDNDLLDYYDIIFDIDSLENLKKKGWQLISDDNGYKKYEDKKDKKNTVVSVIGNKNKGKSFILAKLSGKEIPDGFNITTKGLSVIYPDYEDNNIIFLDTAGFEIPLCENEENFKFITKNEKYLNLKDEEKKKVSIKDYLSDDEKITQIMEFTRDRQNTDYFLQKFILNSADILLCIVNQLNLSDHKFLNRIQEENKNKKIFVIHNLKTFKEKIEVEDYIKNTLLKLVTSKLTQDIYIKINSDKKEETVNNVNQNNVYYKQEFEDSDDKRDKREVIHLFMANDKSNAGNYYNESTLEFIKNQIISHTNIKQFPIIDKVKDFLFEHSGEFFNEPLENKDDLKIIEEDSHQKLKYTNEEKPFELKECYVDELGNANFIQTNYKPSYRVYKVKCNDNDKESNKLFLDIEISGEVDIKDIENPEIVNKNRQNIITITGKRNLTRGASNKTSTSVKSIAEYKPSNFDNNNKMFNLRIYIPNEKCIIGKLNKRVFNVDKGLYRYIYDIQEKNEEKTLDVVIDDDDDEDYEV